MFQQDGTNKVCVASSQALSNKVVLQDLPTITTRKLIDGPESIISMLSLNLINLHRRPSSISSCLYTHVHEASRWI